MDVITDLIGAIGWPVVFVALAIALFGLEALIGGFYAVWFAVGLMVAGLIGALFGVDLVWGILIAGAASLAGLGVWFGVMRGRMAPGDPTAEHINDPYFHLQGRIGEVAEPFAASRGWVRVDDTRYPATGDVPVASRVEITGAEDGVLKVRPVGRLPSAESRAPEG